MKLTLVNKIIRCLRWTLFVICMLVMTACQNRSDSQNSQTPAPTKQEPKPPSSETDGGVGNTGGGNTSSVQTKNTLEFFSNDGADLRKDLIGWLRELRQFASQGSISSDIHKMIDGGLIEDIEKSKFVFSGSCSDSKGNITSMSTLKVNNFLSEVKHPDICINVPKIGTEKASYNDILGNLMHEYSRHFGFEDTEKYGVHSFAWYVSVLLGQEYFTRNLKDSWGDSQRLISQPYLLSQKNHTGVTHTAYSAPGYKVVIHTIPKNDKCQAFELRSYGRKMIFLDGRFLEADKTAPTSSTAFASTSIENASQGVIAPTVPNEITSLWLLFDKAKDCKMDVIFKVYDPIDSNKVVSQGVHENVGYLESPNRAVVSDSIFLRFIALDLSDDLKTLRR